MSVLEKPKKTAEQDWHRADILAELRKKGWSIRSLAKAGNVSPNTLKTVLDKPYPKMERLVANAIGVAPEVIWAARFAERNKRPILTNRF
ncbi:TPA: helix-turn-helix domain-containing protein [Mannheimia haemolytica]|uniref:DNA-binding transcriptional regulator Nlp n=1 Tax=Mannheimia haemolytica TaxID=75985 RepID=A0A3S4YD69_MANHA|nr:MULTISPECIES: helix-turn-helix domain-containing protein [Pasteurellaceae]MBF6982394.1 helix-turn-helix domain-containing protein [Pasteurella multocida]MDW0615965.1 helix-turn-helix domain-containing protein [Mannheimia haemolytica]QLB14029.1 DNA-binding protein [Mannheimia granulomatis]VEI74689.1 DNA-binding transcriptional regulator Nlp [Mannheimia haemolytica]HDL1183809.1 helix-turn-helix domain-containing protein [Mannheimia haemolytica]